MESINKKIEDIMTKNTGEIFSINDFYGLGTKNTIKSVLYRLNEEDKITRLIDGLYTKPKYSEILKEYSYPDANALAEKIADKFSWTISPTGDTALNYTGLSTQVPNEYIYISDGPYRQYDYRNKKILFKHTSNRNITSYSKELSILVQAIRALGKDGIGEEELTLKLPFWIQEILEKIQEINNEKAIRNIK